MKLIWQIENRDIIKVKKFFEINKKSNFVVGRIKRNIEKNFPKVTKEEFWEATITCLLTTQQRSGPKSIVTKFVTRKPFPLSYALCKNNVDLEKLTEDVLIKFGGIRRTKTIAKEIQVNYMVRGWWLARGI